MKIRKRRIARNNRQKGGDTCFSKKMRLRRWYMRLRAASSCAKQRCD
jgi:hypothetical protein